MLRQKLQVLSGFLQSKTGSYKRHHQQYKEQGKIDIERELGRKNIENNLINDAEMRVYDLHEKHPNVKIAVDVGSGTGWSAAAMSTRFETVYAIEPSDAAVSISKTLYPTTTYPNINWINSFAEKALPSLALPSPTLFLTGCVLSHIRDEEVARICKAIDRIAPTGSVFSLAECWGDKPWHQLMWHVRTRDWWQAQFPGWELDFHGPEVPEKDEYKGRYHKGIHGVKVR
jgi:trans-aconitate methyltransferase